MDFNKDKYQNPSDQDTSHVDIRNSFNLQQCIQNHYSEPNLWDEMVKFHKR
jgi:hypothetical protein